MGPSQTPFCHSTAWAMHTANWYASQPMGAASGTKFTGAWGICTHLILQITFTALITDGAIQWMIDLQIAQRCQKSAWD